MEKTKIFDITIALSVLGMIVCLGIEVANKTDVGYNTIGERLRFGWWFYMEGGREQTVIELENYVHLISISNSTSPFITQKLTNETVDIKDRWRVIARELYERDKMVKKII